jgi:hypothetical protein
VLNVLPAVGPGASTRTTVVCTIEGMEQTANAVVTFAGSAPPPADPMAVQDRGLDAPLGTMAPLTSLGKLPTGLKLVESAGVPSAPPPTSVVPAGHVTVIEAVAAGAAGPLTEATALDERGAHRAGGHGVRH